MRSEEFDKKIIEAAEHHQPDYSEKSWPEMKKLLDVHLPEKKNDRRRFFFFLLLLLCLGGGLWLTAVKPWKKQPMADTGNQAAPGNPSAGKQADVADAGNGTPDADKQPAANGTNEKPENTTNTPAPGMVSSTTARQVSTPSAVADNKTTQTNFTQAKNKTTSLVPPVAGRLSNTSGNAAISAGGGKKKGKTKPTADAQNNAVIAANKTNQPTEPEPVADKTTEENVVSKAETVSLLPVAVENVNVPAVENKQDVAASEKQPQNELPLKEPVVAKKPGSRSPLKKSIGFAFTLSAGPDVSAVGVDKLGKVQPVFGAGINVSYGRHFSLSTGYYSVRKIYKAEAADYKFPTRPYHYNYLFEIDGNCKVIEIPITLNWAFNEKQKGSWFVSAGASSFLMKRETYDYMYKYPSGQVTKYTKQFGNKNQHIFSVMSLSGGYRYNLSKSVFVSAEPYVKIPLKGVGAGKLNLNSGGVLFTIGIKPF